MNRMRILFIFLSFLYLPLAYGQAGNVMGKIVDKSNQPLVGASVFIKGTKTGVLTDFDGGYTLTLPQREATLEISYVGHKTKEQMVSQGQTIDVVLEWDTEVLEETVVIGYGSVRKSDLTGAVGVIGANKITERQVVNPVDALSGRVAGVQVNNNAGRPGGAMKVVIRGFNSINASNEPLYVIDGIVGADVSMVNSNDIESMNVLKDASSTAIYGARGASGVVLITTKKGKFEAGTTVNYNGSLGVATMARKLDLLNAKEFMQVLNQSFANDNFSPIDWNKANPNLFAKDGTPLYDTDWQDEMTRTAVSHRHHVSINTGSPTSRTSISLAYQDEQGIMIETWLKRYNAKFSNDTKINKWVQLVSSLNYNYVKESRLDDYRTGASAATSRVMAEFYPILPVKFPNGKYSKFGDFKYPSPVKKGNDFVIGPDGKRSMNYSNLASFWDGDNGVEVSKEVDRDLTTSQLLGNLDLTVRLLDGLTFKSTAAAEVKWAKDAQYTGSSLVEFSGGGANASQVVKNHIYLQTENFLNYDKSFGDHTINIMAGASWNGATQEELSGSGQGFSSDFFNYYNLEVAEKNGIPKSNFTEWRMNSYYARVNYSYKRKYLATLTSRYDGSSVFGKDNRYAFFPSAALAWVINEEDFLKGNPSISTLKLRASVGQTGNAGIDAYSTLASLGNAGVTFSEGSLIQGVVQSRMPNSGLKWETTTQYDLGLDMGFFNDVLNVSVDFYLKNTKDLLLKKPISYVTGYQEVMDNVGEVRNTGLEVTLTTRNISTPKIRWTTSLTLSTNKNEVINLTGDQSDIWNSDFIGINYSLIRKGEALNTVYGLKRAGGGTWSVNEATEAATYGKKPGDKKYVDRNNDGKIDYQNDGFTLGNFFPKVEIGLNNTFVFGDFDVSLDIHAKLGSKGINLSRVTNEQRTWYANSTHDVLKYWTPENQNTMIEKPRTAIGGNNQELQLDDNIVENASFVRFKNLLVGYTVPSFTNANGVVKKFRVYASLENFLLITSYSGYDPEVQNWGGTFSQGAEFFAYPKARTINFGLNLTF